LVRVDRPWEHHLWFYNSVVDNGTHVAIYYHVYVATVKGEDKPGENYQDPYYAATALALSTDGGLSFSKPSLGQVRLNGTRDAHGSSCPGCNGSDTNSEWH
jgi:hypothetical protein